MTIVESDAAVTRGDAARVLQTFTATNSATFTFTPTSGGTRVTWAMDGPKNFVAKALTPRHHMDTMVAATREGARRLKSLVESARGRAPEARRPATERRPRRRRRRALRVVVPARMSDRPDA